MSACLKILRQSGGTYVDFHCSHDEGHDGDCRFVNTAKVDPPEQVVEVEGSPEVVAGFRKMYGYKS